MKNSSFDIYKIFEVDRDGVCIARKGQIIYANTAFQMLFTDKAQGQRVQRLLPEIDPYINEESYVTAVTVGGVVYTVTASRSEDDLLLRILRPDQAVPGVPSAALTQMLSDAFTLRMALDKRLPLDTEDEDPDTRIIYHKYFSILHIIQQLADMDNLSKGEMYCKMQTLDLRELVRDLVDSVAFFIGGNGVTLTAQLPEDICVVRGDRTRLQQLLLILLSNSLGHTDPGGSVTVGLRQAGRRYILSVDDTGEGMTGEEMGWAFTPREVPLLTHTSGAGMGLNIAYGLAKLHGGTIMLQSEPGKGTRVRLTLPASDRLMVRDADDDLPEKPDQILTELANVLSNDAYHPKFRR